MTRVIPADADIYAQSSPHVFLPFLLIEHPALSEPVRVVADLIDYEWNGATWLAVPFGFKLLTDGDSAPETQLVVQNVDRVMGDALRKMSGPAKVSLWILTSADFDLDDEPRTALGTVTPLYQFEGYDLIDVTIDALQITGRVRIRDYRTESYPGIRATQSRCPGLFA